MRSNLAMPRSGAHSFAPLPALLTALIAALVLGACAHAPAGPDGGIPALTRPALQADLPSLDEAHVQPEDAESAILVSWLREVAGDPVGAWEAIADALTGPAAPADAALRVALWSRLHHLAWGPIGVERAAAVVAATPPAIHPLEAWLRTDMQLQVARFASIATEGAESAARAGERAGTVTGEGAGAVTGEGAGAVTGEGADAEERAPRFDSAPWGATRGWRVLGPISDLTTLDFDTPHALDALDVLPDAPVPTLAAGVHPLLLPDKGGDTQLPGRRAGIYVAESWFTLAEPTTLVVAVSGLAAWRAELNGVEVLRRAPEELHEAAFRMRRVTLPAGEHRLRLHLAAGSLDRHFRVRLLADEGAITRFDASPSQAEAPAFSTAPPVTEPGYQSPAGAWRMGAPRAATVLDALVEAELVVLERSNTEASLLAERLEERAGHPVYALAAWRLVASLHDRSSGWQRARALDLLRKGVEAAPEAAGLRLQLARMLALQDLSRSALDEARRALEDRPDLMEAHLLVARLEREAGRYELARPALARAQALHVDHCGLATEAVELRLARNEPVRRVDLPVEWLRCPRVRRVLVQREILPFGDREEGLRILERLAWEAPASEQAAEHFLDAAVGAGDEAAIARALALGQRLRWSPAEALDLRADARWSLDTAPPEADMDASLALEPARLRSHRRASLRAAMPLLPSLRRDALELVAERGTRGVQAEGDLVFLLDRQAIRYFEDGSALAVVHQVAELRTREALNAYGELGIPDGAELLTVRTIKPDGSHRVPDAIGTPDSISLPDLEVGDVIELEYAISAGPQRAGAPGMISPLFFLQRETGPVQRAELEVQIPASWESELIIDARAGSEAPTRSSCGPECVHLRWSADDVMPPVAEDLVPPALERLPSVRLSFGRSTEEARRAFANRIAERTLPDAAIASRARQVVDGARDDAQKLDRLVRWVHDEIADAGQFFSVSASATLAEMEGDRAALLVGLLRSLDMDVSVAFVRSLARGEEQGEVPDLSPWDVHVVRVRSGARTWWVDAGGDHTEVDALAQDLQGRDALVVWGRDAGATLRTPVDPLPAQRRQIRMALRLDADGSATGDVVERYQGEAARSTRAWLDWTEPDERGQRIEEEYQGTFPGLEVRSFRVEGRDGGSGALEMHYEVHIPALLSATAEDGFARRISLLQRRVASAWAGREARSQPLVLVYPLLEELEIRLEAPAGWRLEASLPERALVQERSRFEQRLVQERGARSVTLHRIIDVPAQRVAVEAYPDFAALLRAVERDVELQLSMRRAP